MFREKIETLKDLSKYQPEYTGGNDYDSAKEFIKNKFLEKNHNSDRSIHVEYTCAVDTKVLGQQFVDSVSKVLAKKKQQK